MSTPTTNSTTSWDAFTGRLQDLLDGLLPGQFVVLGTHEPGRAVEGVAPYVQVCRDDDGTWYAEVSSNTFLDPMNRLAFDQEVTLVEQGWCPPRAATGQGSNYSAMGTDTGHLATLMSRALRVAGGATTPAAVTIEAAGAFDDDIPAPDARTVLAPDDGAPTQETMDVLRPRRATDLITAIAWSLPAILGLPEPALPDEDGDFPLRFAGVPVFVHVEREEPVVKVYACVAMDQVLTPVLMRALDQLSATWTCTKVHTFDGQVFVSTTVYADPFVPQHLQAALEHLAEVIPDAVDTIEQAGQPARPDDRGLGGYL